MKLECAHILENIEISEGIFDLKIATTALAAYARPGQFAMLYLESGQLLLPRPISICDIDGDTVRFIYQVVGAGTQELAGKKPGQVIKVLAPLGKGFMLGSSARTVQSKVAIVGGGIGTPPLLYLAKELVAQGAQVDAYLGFRQDTILLEDFEAVVGRLYFATETGNRGHRGRILEVVESLKQDYDEILACGPRPMLNALAAYAQTQGIPCQICTEERMACGLGTCVGCSISIKGTYLRVCTEGPVFYSDEVDRHE